jgi:LuxR family maltose regulon positive regulatory protein
MYGRAVTGELRALERFALRSIELGEQYNLGLTRAWGYYFLGHVALEWNDVQRAQRAFQSALTTRDRHYLVHRESVFGLAVARHALGDRQGAWDLVDTFSPSPALTSDPDEVGPLRTIRARLALLEGDVASAAGWLNMVDFHKVHPTTIGTEHPVFTWVRCLVAQGYEPGLHAAREVLDRSIERSAQLDENRHVIGGLVMRALVRNAEDDRNGALVDLRRALELGLDDRPIRLVVEAGPSLRALLVDLSDDERVGPYAAALSAQLPAAHGNPVAVEPLPLPELTQRERAILELLAAGLTNKEIAQRLTISPLTVKRHTVNLYEKLEVGGRALAVTRGRAIGLIVR